MVDRPRHVARVLDHMLADWTGHGRLDPDRIGIYGFSAGGYTALVAIGGTPDLQRATAHCANEPDEHVCRLGMASDFNTPAVAGRPASAWVHDPRIGAAVIAAPGFGFAFDATALTPVTVLVQLWAAADDRRVPDASNTEIIRKSLPSPPDLRRVEGAGHSAFLMPCNPKFEALEPEVWAMACVDAPGFDRAAFYRQLNDAAIEFFRERLGRDR